MTDFLPYNYLVFLVVFLSALSLGQKILEKTGFVFSHPGEMIVFSVALGLGIYSNAIFILCVAQMLNAPVCFILLLLPLIFCFDRLKETFRLFKQVRWKENWNLLPAIVKLATLAFFVNFLLIFIGASTPPTLSDATNVHLLIPKLYINNQGFTFLSNLQPSNYPCLHIELLYAFVMLLSSDILTQLISIYYLGIILGVIYLLARSYQSQWVSYGAVLFFFFNMDVIVQSSMAWVDMAWNAYALLSFFLIHRWLVSLRENKEDKKYLYLAGVFCGFAAQIKIFSPVITVIFFITILFLLIRDKYSISFAFKNVFFSFAMVAFLIELPYYLKNIWAFGNPFWPFFQDFFGNKNQALIYTADMFKGPVWRKTESNFWNFIVFPWKIILHPHIYHSSPLNPIYLVLLPVFFFIKTPRPDFFRFIPPFLLFFLPFCFLETPEVRFMLIIVAVMSVILIAPAVEISKRDKRLKKLFIIFSALWISIVTLGNGIIQWKSLPFALGLVDRDEYIRSRVGGRFSHQLQWYDSFTFINKNLEEDVKILFPDFHFYHCDRTIVTLVEAKVFNAEKDIEDERILMNNIEEMGLTHILTEDESQVLEKSYEKYKRFNEFLRSQKKTGKIKEIYKKDGISLLEIRT